MLNRLLAFICVAAALVLTGCGGGSSSHSSSVGTTPTQVSSTPLATPVPAVGIHKIQHVVVIMQENRSFDEYFGTYPGADGIPMRDGQPTVCVPDQRM